MWPENLNINIYFLLFAIVFTLRNILEILVKPKGSHKGEGTLSLIAFTILFFITGFSVGYNLFIYGASNMVFYILGLIIFISFHVARIIAIKKMGKSYSQFITPNNNAVLINTGFHKTIRHPLYLFYCLELIGMLLLQFNFLALIAIIADITITLQRIKKEEILLVKNYGDAYMDYQKQTWKLIPYVC